MDAPVKGCSKCHAIRLPNGACSNSECPESLLGFSAKARTESTVEQLSSHAAKDLDSEMSSRSDHAEKISETFRYKKNNILLGGALSMFAAYLVLEFIDIFLESGDLSFLRLVAGVALAAFARICFKFAFEMDDRIMRLQGKLDDLGSNNRSSHPLDDKIAD